MNKLAIKKCITFTFVFIIINSNAISQPLISKIPNYLELAIGEKKCFSSGVFHGCLLSKDLTNGWATLYRNPFGKLIEMTPNQSQELGSFFPCIGGIKCTNNYMVAQKTYPVKVKLQDELEANSNYIFRFKVATINGSSSNVSIKFINWSPKNNCQTLNDIYSGFDKFKLYKCDIVPSEKIKNAEILFETTTEFELIAITDAILEKE
jgi:hypothetical protein